MGRIIYIVFAIMSVGVLCNLLLTGTSQWERIESPSSIVEILPTYYYGPHIQVLTEDGSFYGANVNATTWNIERWIKLDAPIIKEDQRSSVCSVEKLPDSVIPSRPSDLQQCTHFTLEPEASYSYIALDGNRQLWLWISDDYTWYLCVICVPLWLLGLLLIPILSYIPKSHLRAILQDPQS